jgi:hypothetical protein
LLKWPEYVDARRKLLVFYSTSGAVALGKARTIEARRKHLHWLIQHHPDSGLLYWLDPDIHPDLWDSDQTEIRKVKQLWIRQANQPAATGTVLAGAASFIMPYDKPMAQKLLLRELAINPKEARRLLQELDFETILGVNAPRGIYYSVSSVDLNQAHSEFAAEVRSDLAHSQNADLLAYLGKNWLCKLGHCIETAELISIRCL